MEVEVKLRLPDCNAHQKLLSVLSPFHTQTLFQENIFFDGPNSELASNLTALRIRFYNQDSRCILSLKSKPTISNGVSRIEELEHELEPVLGRACVVEPWRLVHLPQPNKVLSRLVDLGLEEGWLGGVVCLGGFKNVRNVHEWEGLTLEVDETVYEFGTTYELECESERPEDAKKKIEQLLQNNQIKYSYSKDNKFAIFRSGKLPV